MNATYTIPYGYAELEALVAQARQLGRVAKTAGMVVGAPLAGLVFVMAAPLAGLAMIAWMAAKAVARNAFVRRVALFVAAPFIALGYVMALPFVGIGTLAYYGARAALR